MHTILRLHVALGLCLATCLIPSLSAQTQPPVCQIVTADQIGPDKQNTTAIQQQLDLCGANSAKQSSVELSPLKGAGFTAGALYIPSNVVLWLGKGVTLNASTNPADFQRTSASRTLACDSTGSAPIPACGTLDANNTGCVALINSCRTANAGVAGPGLIEGHGWTPLTGGVNSGMDWWTLAGLAKAGNYATRLNAPKMIAFQQCTSATLSGFSIHNAPLVHILLTKDSGVNVSQVNIVTPTADHATASFPHNSDGIDISGSSNVQIDRVDILDGDDNIAIEGGGNGPVSNIAVSNSTFRAGHGFSIGSPTSRGVTGVTGTNLRFIGTDNGLRIKSDASNGGVVDQISYNTVCMSGVKNPLVIDPNYSASSGTLLPQFRNIAVGGMWADSGSVTMKSYAGQPPLALTLNNVRIDTPGKISAANANITEISDPNFPFPLAIPVSGDVTVSKSQAPAPAPADIRSYCQSALGVAASGGAAPPGFIDDTFADGNSQRQDTANNSLWLFNGRTNNIRTDQPGSVSFDVRPAATSSEGFWAFFTDAGSPVALSPGDKLSVAVTFSLTGFTNNGQDVRWGVFDSKGTRNTTNLSGGQNDATFINDTGYGLDYFASGTGNPFVIARRAVLSNANVFNNFGDFTPIAGTGAQNRQALVDGVPYTLQYVMERLTATDTRISAAVSGGSLANLNFSATESSPTPNTAFDYFAFRIGGTNFTSKIAFSEIKIQYTPAAPVITSQPQPGALTVQVGSNVTLAFGASGNGLTYQWQNNGQPLAGNASASTPTLTLNNVQLSDAGIYTVVVTNAGGTVTSIPVTLAVSTSPVPPAPAITAQPLNTTIGVGNSARLIVTASGDNLVYQWFRSGVLIPGATGSQLAFQRAQVGDAGTYSVVVGNSSGSVSSATVTLLVTSHMLPVGFRPWNLQSGICVDTGLFIAFDQTPLIGKTGQVRIYNSAGVLMDSIDMSANPQTRLNGGVPYVYYPVLVVTGNIVGIYPHKPLPYNDVYSVAIDPGVITDAGGAPFAGFSDSHFWNFTTQTAAPAPGTSALSVAWDGGHFCTTQAAIDFVPANNTRPVVITVGKGTFTEIVYVPSNKPFLTVRGADRDGTVIQYANNNNLNSGNTRAMFGVDAPDFTLENITLRNTTPHGGSQAETFRGNNKRILVNRASLYSFQDTLMLQGLGMVTDSYIEGDVDFMWGNGAVFFQNSELKAVTSGGYYTQIRNGLGQNGNFYVNCRLTATPGVSGMYLGRIDPTVFPYSQTAYINCMLGPHISPAGWLLNNAASAPKLQYWEYQNTDFSGNAADVSKRLADSRQMTAPEAALWSDPAFVLGGWVPYTVNATSSFAATGAPLTVNFSAAPGHSEKDWVGLFAAEDADSAPLVVQLTGNSTTGHLSFVAPAKAGLYEFRYVRNDGALRQATGNRIVVQ